MKAALMLLILTACAAPPEPKPVPTKAGWQQKLIQIPGHRMQAERETI